MNELAKIENGNLIVDEEYSKKYKLFLQLKDYIELADKELKQRVKDFMETTGKTNVVASGLCFEYRKGTVRTSLDSKRLKEELPDIYEEFSKTSQVASSVVVKVLDD